MKSLNQMKPKHRKIVDACRAMKSFGITPAKTKTTLKGLLKLYENNWELIEDENYRVLFDVLMPEEEVYLYFLFFNSVLLYVLFGLWNCYYIMVLFLTMFIYYNH